MTRTCSKIVLDLPPDESPVEQDVGTVRRMYQHGARFDRLFGVEHEGQGLVLDIDFFDSVFGQGPRVCHHGSNPFAGIAGDVDCQRAARHVWRVEPGHQRQCGGGEFTSIQHIMNTGHGEGGALVDRDDARCGVRTGQQCDVFGVWQIDVRDEPALACDEAAVLAHAPVGRHKPMLVSTHL